MKYKIAIFDLDGTILNTLEDLADSVNYCLEKFNMPKRTQNEIRGFLGGGIRKLIEQSAPRGTDSKVLDEMFDLFNQYYKDHCAIKSRPYEGICEVLEKLKAENIKICVVSNKADYAVKILCEKYFKNLLDYCAGEKEGIPKKPDPKSVYLAVENFGFKTKETVYIGDSEVDFKTAQNAGTGCILVSWGFRDIEFLKTLGAKIVNEPAGILAELLKQNP